MPATATATATKTTRTRKPSAFRPITRVTIALHGQVDVSLAGTAALAETLAAYFTDHGYDTRAVSRTRKSTKTAAKSTGVASLMLYAAPAGYKFPTSVGADRGMRVDADIAAFIRSTAESMGLDPKDSDATNAVLRKLLEKASK